MVLTILEKSSKWEGLSHIVWKITNVFSSEFNGAGLGLAASAVLLRSDAPQTLKSFTRPRCWHSKVFGQHPFNIIELSFRKMETNSSPKASNPMTMWPHCAATELHFGVLEVLLKHQSEILYTDCCNRLHSDARLPCSAVHRDGPRSLVTLKANVQLYGCKNEIHLSGCNGSRMHEVQLCVQRMPRIVQRNTGKRAIWGQVHWKNPRPNQAAYGPVRQAEVAWEPDCRRRNSLVPKLTDSNHMSSDPLGLSSGLRLLGREGIPQGSDCGCLDLLAAWTAVSAALFPVYH